MTNSAQHRSWTRNWLAGSALATAIVFALATTQPAHAQSYSVLYSFQGLSDGEDPRAGVTLDQAGNLYGTAFGGISNGGSVFKLTRKGAGWVFSTLFNFTTIDSGLNPDARVIFGPDGSLYGTTNSGGQYTYYGTVFNLKPPLTPCKAAFCPWVETVLHSFNGYYGYYPVGDLIFDKACNLYGAAALGLSSGTAYQLTPSQGSWTFTILSIDQMPGPPTAGFTLDPASNLYSSTYIGDGGTVFELTYPGWQLQILHQFDYHDGSGLNGGVTFDNAGNLYGGTGGGGAYGEGTVFEMSPSGGGWTFNTIYNFTMGDQNYAGGPYAPLTMDAAGNLYGTTHSGGAYLHGSVFKLSPSNGGWTFTDLHDFCAGGESCSDGAYPFSNVVFDNQGNLFGTASQGGTCRYGNCGVVWEITP
jgi:uncharacterized repeat protein (TIGR03803 family)